MMQRANYLISIYIQRYHFFSQFVEDTINISLVHFHGHRISLNALRQSIQKDAIILITVTAFFQEDSVDNQQVI